MDAEFCVEALKEALRRYGAPEIFNTDQGVQFTCEAFTGVLKDHKIAISMDAKARWVDNVFVERLWRTVSSANTRQDRTLAPDAEEPDIARELLLTG